MTNVINNNDKCHYHNDNGIIIITYVTKFVIFSEDSEKISFLTSKK